MALLTRRSRGPRPLRGWWFALLAMAPGRLAAQEAAPLEYRIKAAYLLNFARYVEWPRESFDTPDSPIRVCVLGTDPFGGALQTTLAGRTAQGRPIAVAQVEAPAEARDCHMVFIAGTEWRRRPDVLRAVQAEGVLTVGEGEEFTAAGGVLSFVPIERTVRFTVNLARGDDARLRISSRMLALASEVRGRRPDP